MTQHRRRQLDREPPPVSVDRRALRPQPQAFGFPTDAGGETAVELLAVPWRHDQVADGLADGFLARPAEELPRLRVPVRDDPGTVHRHVGLVHRLDRAPSRVLGSHVGALGALALRDVLGNRHASDHLASIADRHDPQPELAPADRRRVLERAALTPQRRLVVTREHVALLAGYDVGEPLALNLPRRQPALRESATGHELQPQVTVVERDRGLWQVLEQQPVAAVGRPRPREAPEERRGRRGKHRDRDDRGQHRSPLPGTGRPERPGGAALSRRLGCWP